MTEQTNTQIRILELRPDVARQDIAGEKRIQVLHRVIRVRVVHVGDDQVRRQTRQARRVRGKVLQRDGPRLTHRNRDACGEVLGNGIVERHLSLPAMSASSNEVNTFVTDPISNTVWPSTGRASDFPNVP